LTDSVSAPGSGVIDGAIEGVGEMEFAWGVFVGKKVGVVVGIPKKVAIRVVLLVGESVGAGTLADAVGKGVLTGRVNVGAAMGGDIAGPVQAVTKVKPSTSTATTLIVLFGIVILMGGFLDNDPKQADYDPILPCHLSA